MSDDPDDLSALTPGHFLIGEPLTTIPEPSIRNPDVPSLPMVTHPTMPPVLLVQMAYGMLKAPSLYLEMAPPFE